MVNFQYELSEHPVIGFVISVSLYVLGLVPPLLFVKIPVIVMQLFQLAAWTVAIFVGCITIFEWIKKQTWFKKK